jgi:prepilin-type N-terminal cleavage/methylation domain-containing protein
VSGRGGAPRRPRPARVGTSRGYTLIELVFVAGLVAILAAAAIPQLSAGVEHSRTVGAARYFASRLALARAQAVARSANVALLLTAAEGTFVVSTYVDGNGDGVRTRDITAGVDILIDVPVRLSYLFPHVALFLNDPAATSTFDTSALMSFSPLGTASSRTLYLRGADGSQYAVRVLGATGRTRVLRLVASNGAWVEVL